MVKYLVCRRGTLTTTIVKKRYIRQNREIARFVLTSSPKDCEVIDDVAVCLFIGSTLHNQFGFAVSKVKLLVCFRKILSCGSKSLSYRPSWTNVSGARLPWKMWMLQKNS